MNTSALDADSGGSPDDLRRARRTQLEGKRKADLVAMARRGVRTRQGTRSELVETARPLDNWRKDEVIAWILDVEFRPPT